MTKKQLILFIDGLLVVVWGVSVVLFNNWFSWVLLAVCLGGLGVSVGMKND